VKALLDAHAFIWWMLDMPALSERCRSILRDTDNDILFSVASSYEIAYKAEQGRLTLPEPSAVYIRDRLAANAFGSLAIELSHGLRAATLPRLHGDPFDRILVAQAQIEAMPILTADPAIGRYEVETIW
jgi:PIN domain nuclease of toxin-antitoxin system